jgi:hypothetical protein
MNHLLGAMRILLHLAKTLRIKLHRATTLRMMLMVHPFKMVYPVFSRFMILEFFTRP